jgi:bacillithiol synthase
MDMLTLKEFPGIPPLVHETIAGIAHIDFGFRTYPDPVAWIEQSKRESEHPRPRAEIVSAIRKQYANISMPDAVNRNLETLADPATMAVVTGQQVGLAGGPLLTLYKAMTAVALAERLQRGTGIKTVPIFWMATSDHNLTEAAQVHWLTLDNQMAHFKDTRQGNRIPVGSLPVGNLGNDLIARLTSDIPSTDFSAEYIKLLKQAYQPDATFAGAFRQWGTELLGKHGLIFLDPVDPTIKQLSSPFLQAAVAEVDDRLERIVERSKMIERSGYKSQAPAEIGRPALFLLDEGQRRKIVLEGKAIRGMSDIIMSRLDLAKIARDEPERLSAGVTLRPILQGWLLPTGAYIAGPHEMAYWSQLTDAFTQLGVEKPAVVSRASFTVIEPKVAKWLEKYDLSPKDMYVGLKAITAQLLSTRRDDDADHAFAALSESLETHERVLTDMSRSSDFSGSEQVVDSSFRKMQYHVDKLRHAFSERSSRRHSTLLKHVEQLSNHIFPGGSPQERVISPIYYLVRYGDKFLNGLRKSALNAVGRHVFVDLKEWQ